MQTKKQAINKTTLASMYGISIGTLKNWLKKIDFYKKNEIEEGKRLFNPKEIAFIYDKLGNPEIE